MARIRTIKPDFFLDDDLAEIDIYARFVFVGLWTQADKEGKLEDKPRRIKAVIMPYENKDIEILLKILTDRGFITRYEIKDKKYIIINNFLKHQRPHHTEQESQIPSPNGTTTVKQPSNNGDNPDGREGKGREGKGKEGSPKKEFSEDSLEIILSKKLLNWIYENSPKAKVKPDSLQKWASEVDKMLRLDNRTQEEMERLINWTQKHNFWKTNIRSMGKLREKFDNLELQMRQAPTEPKDMKEQIREIQRKEDAKVNQAK